MRYDLAHVQHAFSWCSAGVCYLGECHELGGGLCINQLFPADALLVLLDSVLERAGDYAPNRSVYALLITMKQADLWRASAHPKL